MRVKELDSNLIISGEAWTGLYEKNTLIALVLPDIFLPRRPAAIN